VSERLPSCNLLHLKTQTRRPERAKATFKKILKELQSFKKLATDITPWQVFQIPKNGDFGYGSPDHSRI